MVGDFAVGKTSLTQQFVNQIFSEQYLTTIGVKIDTKHVESSNGQRCKLVVWDVAGRDSLTPLQINYLMGASGFLLVVDGTRRESIDSVKFLVDSARKKIPNAPFIILLNKHDLDNDWKFDDKDQNLFTKNGWKFLTSSAKTGENVETAFITLVDTMLSQTD